MQKSDIGIGYGATILFEYHGVTYKGIIQYVMVEYSYTNYELVYYNLVYSKTLKRLIAFVDNRLLYTRDVLTEKFNKLSPNESELYNILWVAKRTYLQESYAKNLQIISKTDGFSIPHNQSIIFKSKSKHENQNKKTIKKYNFI